MEEENKKHLEELLKIVNYYKNIPYDNKVDNYHYVGTQRHKDMVVHLYTGEKYGHTIAGKHIQDIKKSELEKKLE